MSEEELELFTDDPTEFARQSFGGESLSLCLFTRRDVPRLTDEHAHTDFITDSYASPTSSALTFLSALVDIRAKSTLLPLLQFIQSVVEKCVLPSLQLLAEPVR